MPARVLLSTLIALSFVALPLPTPAQAATPAPPATPAALTTTDVVSLRQVAAAALSNDGSLAAYVLDVPRGGDEPNGPSWRRLYVRSTKGGPERPFVTGDVQIGAPAFSPDDRFVGFLAKRGEQKHPQVWAIPTDGGEAQPVTKHGAGVESFAWLPDGRVVYVAAAPRSKREETLAEKDYAPRIYEEDLRERAVWIAPFAFGEEPAEGARLTSGVSVWQLDASADGRRLALGASRRPLVDDMYMFQDIYAVDVPAAGATVEPVEPRLLFDPPGKLGTVRISPDGTRVAFTAAASQADHAPSGAWVYSEGEDDGKAADLLAVRQLTPPDFEGHAWAIAWWDDESVVYVASEGVWTTWSQLDITGRAPKRDVIYLAQKTGVIADVPYIARAARKAVFLGHAATHPRELFLWERGRTKRLTDSNPWLAERTFGEQEVVSYAARDGLRIEGILIHPVAGSVAAGARPPLLVDVHGGPEGNISNGWLSGYFHPGQVAAAAGYAVFLPNYRGSTGRGLEFAASAFGEPAGAEFDDIADGIRHLTGPEGIADPTRVGLLGGSYGGYAANWFATHHTELVRAVVSFVGVSDLVSKRLLTDIPFEDLYVHMGAPVRASWEKMLARSPIRWAEKSRTAVLLLHGDADPRVHPSQSQEMYRALKMAEHPAVRLVYYPGEGHGNRKRSYRLDTALRTLAWMDWYVKEGKPLDGPLPPADMGDDYGVELPKDAPDE